VASLVDSVNQFTQRGEHFGLMTELSLARELSKLTGMRSTSFTYVACNCAWPQPLKLSCECIWMRYFHVSLIIDHDDNFGGAELTDRL
jgi:hypothetical protein